MPDKGHSVEPKKAAPEPVFAVVSSILFVVIAEGMLSMRHTRFFNPGLELMILAVAAISLMPVFEVFSHLSTLMKIAFCGWSIYLGSALAASILELFG